MEQWIKFKACIARRSNLTLYVIVTLRSSPTEKGKKDYQCNGQTVNGQTVKQSNGQAWNVGRNSGCFLRSFRGVTFLFRTNALVLSQPVNACRAVRPRLTSTPGSLATAWIFKRRRLSPVACLLRYSKTSSSHEELW